MKVLFVSLIFFISTLTFSQTANIATWKNNAKGCYNLIHDDYGDSGVDGIWQYADTICSNRGVKFTFGAITNSCEASRNINGYGSPYAYAKNVMMDQHGHEIMNHSHTHDCAVPTTWSPCDILNGWGMDPSSANFNTQLVTSTESIRDNTGHYPRYFIFPFDRFSNDANDKLKELGYIGSRTGWNAQAGGTGYHRNGYDNYDLANFYPDSDGFFRTAVVVKASDVGLGGVTANEMEYWAQYAIDNGVWVNRELHNVGNSGWGHISVDNYRTHLDFLKEKVDANDLWIGTISEILTYQIQKLNYSPNAVYASADNEINVSWNTPSFNVESYLNNLDLKSPITLNVDVAQLGTTDDLLVLQNGNTIPHTLNGTILSVDLYPHEGGVNISTNGQPCLTVCLVTDLSTSNSSVNDGSSFTLNVGATGSGTLLFAWYRDATLISTTATGSLTISDVDVSDAGDYSVVISNGSTSITSQSVSIAVNGQSPYLGLVASVPGTLEAEKYDSGGQGISYNEINQSWEPADIGYRQDGILDVDEQPTTDPSDAGGYHVGYTSAGEWLEYTVDVQTAGDYDISFRLATNDATRTLQLLDENSVDLINGLSVPNTGGWETWQTIEVNDVTLASGEQVLRLYWPEGNVDVNWINFQLVSTNIVVDFEASDSEVCLGESIVFTDRTNTNSSSYSWDFGDGITRSGKGPHTITYSNSGTKTVSLNVDGEEKTYTNMITVNSIPTVSTSNPSVQCGGNVNLSNSVTNSAGSSLSFYSNSSLTNSISSVVSSSGTYYVDASANGCESDAESIIVQIDEAVSNASAGNDISTCDATASISASSPLIGTGSWSKVSGIGSFSPSGVNANVTGLQQGQDLVLRWTVASGNSCPNDFDDVTISRYPSVTIATSNPSSQCGGTVNLSSYVTKGSNTSLSFYSNSGLTNSISSTVSSSGTYYVQGEENGCLSSSRSIVVDIDSPISNVSAGNDITTCSSTASVSASTPVNGTGTWSKLSGTGSISSTNGTSVDVSGLQNGSSLVLRWTVVSSGSCPSQSEDVRVTRSNSITPSVSISAGESEVCEGSSVVVSLSHNLSNPSVVWTKNSSNIGGGTSISSVMTTSGTFSAAVTYDDCGVSRTVNTNSVTVDAVAEPSVNAGSNISSCGTTAISLNGSSSESNVSWSSNGSGSFTNPNALNTTYNVSNADVSNGNVTIMLTGSNSVCGSTTSSLILTLSDTESVDAGEDFQVCISDDKTITLNGTSSSSNVTWSTNGTGFFDNSNTVNTVYNYSTADEGLTALTFTLTSNGIGACDDASSTVDVMLDVCSGLSNTFSSNEINVYPNPFLDTFIIDNAAGVEVSYELYTMSGQLLFKGNTGDRETVNTEDVPSGIYVLVVSSQDKTMSTKLVKD